jgi:tRNA modification GTPase
VVLVCGERSHDLEITADFVAARSAAPRLRVRTKADLVINSDEMSNDAIAVSAESGTGLQKLLEAIQGMLSTKSEPADVDAPILTRARHQQALSAACRELEEFTSVWRDAKLPATIASVHLRTAVFQLEELIGTVDVEDVLDRLFSSFCVGK